MTSEEEFRDEMFAAFPERPYVKATRDEFEAYAKAKRDLEMQQLAFEVHEDYVAAVEETREMAARLDARSYSKAVESPPVKVLGNYTTSDLAPKRWWQVWR